MTFSELVDWLKISNRSAKLLFLDVCGQHSVEDLRELAMAGESQSVDGAIDCTGLNSSCQWI